MLLKGKVVLYLRTGTGLTRAEEAIKKATKATIRCIPLDNVEEAGKCVFSGKPSIQRVLFAKAY